MELNNVRGRFDLRKKLVFPMRFFHSFRERTTSIFDLVNRYMKEGAKEKFYFAYRIQMNQLYLREALVNCSFHREIFFEKTSLITAEHLMSVADKILHGVFSSELDRGPVPIDTLFCRNSAPEQKVRFYDELFECLCVEICLLVKQSFFVVGSGLFLRVVSYRNDKIALELGCTKDATRKNAGMLLISLLKGKQVKDLKTLFKKVFDQKFFVVSNQDELLFRIEM